MYFPQPAVDMTKVEIDGPPIPTPAPVVPSGPYLGSTAVVPGTIEAEAFDYGGEGVSYHDTTAGNSGGVSWLYLGFS